jgi:hypothetical protein
VLASILRFGIPLPVAQHRVIHRGQPRRVDLCYRDEWSALEAKSFVWYRQRSSSIATRCAATSCNWPASQLPLTFAQWSRPQRLTQARISGG